MNATGTPTGDPESCQLLAAGGHSRLIVLHYNHTGRLAGRAGAEEVGLGASVKTVFITGLGFPGGSQQ